MSFLRNLSFAKSENETTSTNVAAEDDNSINSSSTQFASGLFTAGTTKLFDSMNATTSSITSGISTKFGQLKRMASQDAFPETEKLQDGEEPNWNHNSNARRSSKNSVSSQETAADHKTTTAAATAPADSRFNNSGATRAPPLQSSKVVMQEQTTTTARGTTPPTRPEQPPPPVRRRSSSEQGGGSGAATKPRPPKPPPPKMVPRRQDTSPLEKNTHHRAPLLVTNNNSGGGGGALQKHMSMDSGARRHSHNRDSNYIADLSNLTKLECQRIVSEMGNLVSFDESDDKMLQDRAFVQTFIQHLLKGLSLTQEEKARFGELCQNHACRSWFAKCIEKQNLRDKAITEAVFYKLVQYFAVVLFECTESRDFSPAKDLMNSSFYIYAERIPSGTNQKSSIYLYNFLKDQPIWQSLEYWESALLSSIQEERVNHIRRKQTSREAIPFNQLSLYVKHMKSFSLGKDLCQEFVMKQSRLLTISDEERSILKNQIDSME